jgi:hypothetical protein
MDSEIIIKAVLGLAVVLFFNYGSGFLKKLTEEGSVELTPRPPPVPRRTRRVRNAPPPLAPEPEPSAPVAAVHLDDTSLVVTRPARAHTRMQFRGSAALRQALVAREVLGLPLSLRPPRF